MPLTYGDGDPNIPTAARAAHDRAQAEGREGYLDPGTGLMVFTAGALAARGTCCGGGCRHCPFSAVEQRSAERARVRGEG